LISSFITPEIYRRG